MATYYIDEDGIDDAGRNGSESQPWATLHYAINTRASTYDVIHVNAGSYIENTSCYCPVGLKIEGDGESNTTITSNDPATYANTFRLFYMDSSTTLTQGDHKISNIKFDGSSGVYFYIIFRIYYRSHIEFDHVTFTGIRYCSIDLYGGDDVYATNVSIHDCTFYDASGASTPTSGWSSCGAIKIGGTEGALIYNNSIINPAGSDSSHLRGICISSAYYHQRGTKIYNNTIKKYNNPTGEKAFAIEILGLTGGIEIFNNTIDPSIDMVRIRKGSYSFGVMVYNNIVGPETKGVVDYPAFTTESYMYGVYIFNNYVRNVTQCVSISMNGMAYEAGGMTDCECIDFYYYNNVASNLGATMRACTFSESTNFITSTAHGLSESDGDVVRLTGDLPTVTTETEPQLTEKIGRYFVRNQTTDTFQISGTASGVIKDFTESTSGYWGTPIYSRAFKIDVVQYLCTFDHTTNKITQVTTTLFFTFIKNMRVRFTGIIPPGLSSSTIYYITNVDTPNRQFQVTEEYEGSEVADFDAPGAGSSYFTMVPNLSNIKICNNVFENDPACLMNDGVYVICEGSITNLHILNNIFLNFLYYPFRGSENHCTMRGLKYKNNLVYNCLTANTPYWESNFDPGADYETSGNITGSDPVFVGGSPYDYHLQTSSPAKYTGVHSNIGTDKDGKPYKNPPSMGSYEFDADGSIVIKSHIGGHGIV